MKCNTNMECNKEYSRTQYYAMQNTGAIIQQQNTHIHINITYHLNFVFSIVFNYDLQIIFINFIVVGLRKIPPP